MIKHVDANIENVEFNSNDIVLLENCVVSNVKFNCATIILVGRVSFTKCVFNYPQRADIIAITSGTHVDFCKCVAAQRFNILKGGDTIVHGQPRSDNMNVKIKCTKDHTIVLSDYYFQD